MALMEAPAAAERCFQAEQVQATHALHVSQERDGKDSLLLH